jgi:hypothetical protein
VELRSTKLMQAFSFIRTHVHLSELTFTHVHLSELTFTHVHSRSFNVHLTFIGSEIRFINPKLASETCRVFPFEKVQLYVRSLGGCHIRIDSPSDIADQHQWNATRNAEIWRHDSFHGASPATRSRRSHAPCDQNTCARGLDLSPRRPYPWFRSP